MQTSKEVQQILRQFHGKEKLLHHWVAGFVDGEGSFSVAIVRHPTQKIGWMINPVFQVYQHQQHREVLEIMHYVFQTGSIYRKSGIHPVLNFSIDSRRSLLERVIPFFDRNPLIVKRDAFQKFRTIVYAMEAGEHHEREGFRRLVTIAFTMNQQGKGRKYTIEEIFAQIK